MERHPLTPMTDPDLRRCLGRQARGPVGLVPLDTVRRGAGALRDALEAEGAAGRRLVVVDAVVDDDLRTIGAAAAGHALVTGGSGVALGLPANLRAAGLLGEGVARFTGLAGRAWSCPALARQRPCNRWRFTGPAIPAWRSIRPRSRTAR